MRPISFQREFIIHPQGSCLASFGDTRVLCTAIIEETVPPFLEGAGRGWVTAEYAMLPASTGGGRKRRELLKRDGRNVEISRLIGRSLRAGVDMARLGPVSILVDCDVLQADGGTRTVAVSGGWVALHDALSALAARRGESDVAAYLRGQVAAVSVGIVDGEVVCDLDYSRDSRATVDMNVVRMNDALVEIQGTGERGTFDRRELGLMLDAADAGIAEIFEAQRRALG